MTDFYGLPVSRTNEARLSTWGRWFRWGATFVLVVFAVLGVCAFYRVFINPPDLNIEATGQRTANEHDQIGGFAADFVETWLTSTDSGSSTLSTFIDMDLAGPPPPRDTAAASEARTRQVAILYRGRVAEVEQYSVTVTVMERPIAAAPARRKFYRMPLIVWHQQPRIIGWPVPVNGPGPGVQVKLEYPKTLEPAAPLYRTLGEFVATYLTQTTGMDRYALPGTVSPVGGYSSAHLTSAQLSEALPEKPPVGYKIRALLQVSARTGQKVPVSITMPVTLENSNGTWMISGIDLVPVLSKTSPRPVGNK